ncbi:cysteine desulfurase [Vibrio sp. D404a]|uniref:cysteine desulfurase n=1 Tax=unclassified Vibrio TaxID=2614977 RepID=UPI00255596BB|nr:MULTISPECIES: cysteine desulfurase [unclassified Vibrio]MDK9740111.1 cysteine desulfurase [Vibrio sp. D404a]MDK9799322.1 cysteine desulfurase [Vibrio sp. D449a]
MIDSIVTASPWFSDFPALKTQVYDKPLVYLDSAATAQTPQVVIDRMTQFYQHDYASVHRGVHFLSSKATEEMELVREKVSHFISARSRENIVFTKGTTEAINLVANSYLRPRLKPGDEIIVTEMEHHANLVPWQLLSEIYDITIRVWPMAENGYLNLNDLVSLMNNKTKLLAISHVSNVLGRVNPIKTIVKAAHKAKVPVLVDGAQAVMHQEVNVADLGCDFYAFSGHKLYGPTGIGVLYAKKEHLDTMVPWEGGGAMIDQVTLPLGTSFGQAPWKFEAGTPNIAGILGLGAAIDYLEAIGFKEISAYEKSIMYYLVDSIKQLPEIELYGDDENRTGLLAFNMKNQHSFDVGSFLDRYGIAIRTGHHCAMPLIKRLGQNSVCRASVGMYTGPKDVDMLCQALKRISQLLR